MVRLERILYEKAINNNLLGRARKIKSPMAWFNKEPNINEGVYWPGGLFIQKLTEPFIERLASLEYKFLYNLSKTRGIPLESFLSLKEEDWRRCVLTENIKRENWHPWVEILHSHIRCRYFKVDKFQPGFEVPDYIVDETHALPYIETMSYSDGIQDLIGEYTREMMPKVYMFRSRRVILDILIFHGLFHRKNWNRLFYNEASYVEEEKEIQEDLKNLRNSIDMTNPKNQENFKNWLEKKIKLFPGTYTREGEPFDYETFFNKQAILNNHMKPN